MKHCTKTFRLFFILCMFYSCYSPRYIYSPPAENVPLLHKKNDAELAINYSGSFNVLNKKGDHSYGFDLHTAWAFSRHFAAIGNAAFTRESNNANDTYFYGDTSLLSYKINTAEIGIGYFSSLRNNKKLQLQVFAGAGTGSLAINDSYNSAALLINKFYKARVTKLFLQPSFVYNLTPSFSTAISSRFTALVFTHVRTNYTNEEQDNYILDSVTTAPVFFWEPAFTYIFSFKKFPLKLRLQGVLTVLMNHRFVEYKSANLAFGLIADFDKKKRIAHFSKTNAP